MTEHDDGFDLMRVNVSLPCMVPVVPGTGDARAPLDQRTEVCAVDAFWIIGRAWICDLHAQQVLGSAFDRAAEGHEALYHGMPWAERHRYEQSMARAGLWPGHPLAEASTTSSGGVA